MTSALTLGAGFLSSTAMGELRMASTFTDNAILQREMAVPVWGTALPGAQITVEFGNQKQTAKADRDGKWSLQLTPMEASQKPRKLTATSSRSSRIELDNILVGEVWICSGQSNMQMSYNRIPELKPLASKANNLRSFTVKNTVSFVEEDFCEGQWDEKIPDSAVAFAFAYFLEEAGDIPVGIIQTSWGSSSLEAWMPRKMTKTVPHFKTMMKEFDADTETLDKITAILEGPKPWSQKDDIFLRRQTNVLYNAMMHPLIPYACRGLVWYQGERNTQSMFELRQQPWYMRHSGMLKYGDTLKAWIQQNRADWGHEEMEFLLVMLPGYAKGAKGGPENPNTNSWAWMRESQLKALELPHTSVANTIDLGDVKNVHPTDKLPVGQRLALLAARDTLGMEVVAEGPALNRVEARGDTVVVHFDQAEGLKTRNGKAPTGFWLADKAGHWVKAEAEVKGETVQLHSPQLTKPRFVRYAFAGKPQVNLINGADLPAYPFRTDSFAPPQ